MAWNTRGLRGSTLEEMINLTNSNYKEKNLALIEKVPTSIVPVAINNKTRMITSAYFEKKSTVDYIGVVQGIAVCFDAKETSHKYLPLQNVHQHQIDFLQAFEKQKGVAFLIVYFSQYDEYFYLTCRQLVKAWNDAQNGGKKSISYKDFSKEYRIFCKDGFLLHYLETINVDLDSR